MDLWFLHFSHGLNFTRWLLWIPLLPLFGALILGTVPPLLRKWQRTAPHFDREAEKALVNGVAVGSVALAFLLALACFVRLTEHDGPRDLHVVAYEWFRVSLRDATIPVRVALTMDHLSGVMTLVVTGVGGLIHLYAVGYMSEEKSYSRFFCYLNLFTASMLVLVLASNMPLMFVGWEGVGLCSYLLIGFWWENPAYAAAGRKAFVANRIGDFGVIIGMFLLAAAASSFEFVDINANAPGMIADLSIDRATTLPVPMVTVACLFLFLGCAGKSAQIPLYVWLPDAMAGPTPVSALIHAATMVTAGVYLCCRLSPVFVQSPVAMATIAIIGAATALLAATIALVQNEMKKILAYSTVSQLGFMFAGVGVGTFAGGFFHVFTHAFFKACLFLGAGSVMHAVGAHGDADIRKLGGLRGKMPITHWTFVASCLAIAGFIGTSGFFSKDELLLGALLAGQTPWAGFPSWVGWTVFVVLALTALMTAFYMFRLYFRTFGGEYRRSLEHAEGESAEEHAAHAHDHAYDEHPHESPWQMTSPLMVLGTGAIIVGFLGMPEWWHVPSYWEHWLAPNLATLPRIGGLPEAAVSSAGMTAMGVGTVVALLGIGVAWAFYGSATNTTPATIARSMGPLYRWAMNKWYVDELYDHTILALSRLLARFSAAFDKTIVDGILATLTSAIVRLGSWVFTRPQNGLVYSYGAVMVVGVAVLFAWVVVPHPGLKHAVRNNEVKLVAGTGLGYEYRWDGDGDGEWDTNWDASATEMEHTFDDVKSYRAGAAIIDTYHIGIDHEEVRLAHGETYTLTGAQLGPDWAVEGGSGVRPSFTWRDHRLVVRANGARALYHGGPAGEEVTLEPGDMIQIGQCAVRAAVVVRSTVEVRNAFGYVAREDADVVITPPVGGGEAHAQLGGGN